MSNANVCCMSNRGWIPDPSPSEPGLGQTLEIIIGLGSGSTHQRDNALNIQYFKIS